jgi:guanine deaminase
MMEFLGELSRERGIPVHSHMAEGDFDVEMVEKSFPEEKNYGRVYDRFGLFGNGISVMAHCLNNSDEEIRLMAEKQVIAVHCPVAALDSGSSYLFPARKYLDAGVTVGLGSDIGGGHTLNMMQTMVAAIWTSRQVCGERPLTVPEVLYMATKGGGKAFGRVGSFEPGYEFDALVIDDAESEAPVSHSLKERLIRFLYCGEASEIRRCFCCGKEV